MTLDTAKPHVFDATAANFEADVLQKSLETPVLVDFWAEWCGPCKTLGPILEKLAGEYNGAFVLAKVDVDKEQELGAAFQVRSIPTVFLVKGGQLVDGFPGALPEGQLREFLKHHGIEPAAAPEQEAPETEAVPLDPHAEVVRLRSEVAAHPGDDNLKLDLALALLKTGAAREAEQLLDALPANLAMTTARCAPGRAWASRHCLLTPRLSKCSNPRSPAIPTTSARATCSACSGSSPAIRRPGWTNSSRCCAATGASTMDSRASR
jgi:putative thioredoxin